MSLEVGKTYKTRGGEIVKIVSADGCDQYKFRDSNRWTYTKDGLRYDWIPDHEYNLVEEVTAPTKKPKLKLEVGKTYRDGCGEIHKITHNKSNSDYPEHIYWSKWRSYTVDGFWQCDKDKEAHKYNLIEEVTAPTKKPKLKLEVGKTYRDGCGEIHKITHNKSNSDYPEHIYWSDERSYTVEGFFSPDKSKSKYNLIEEVETKTTTKEGQPKMKYYRTTAKSTETNIPVGTIVTLFKDDGSQMPRYKEVNSDKYQLLYTDRLEEINVKTVKTVISPASKLVKILEDSGYKVDDDGDWVKDCGDEIFVHKMFYFCGKEPDKDYTWLPEWLEEKVVFDSTVNTFNARQFIVDFMKKKRELSHESYLYQRDIDEIENEWSNDECEKVAGRILRQVEVNFTSSCCPFCIKFTGFCYNCSYGKRHEVCSDDDSDFGKYIRPTTRGKYGSELMDFVNNYPGARK